MMTWQALPAKGRWLNSYMIGANSYQVLSLPEDWEHNLFEENIEAFRRSGTEHHYGIVRCRSGRSDLWLVPIRLENSKLLALSLLLSEVLSGKPLREGFWRPFDLIWDGDVQGLVMNPIPRERFMPIRSFLPDPQAPRWQMAEELFLRVEQLHEAGLTLNGFSREQVWVDAESHRIVLLLGETLSLLDRREPAYRGGFSAVPEKLEYAFGKSAATLDGVTRDIFSAAVMAFYLLFYTHPFIGEAYGQLLRDQYSVAYQNDPAYLFDPAGKNGPGHMELGRQVTAQWERTRPSLRDMFDRFFLDVCHPERIGSEETEIWRHPAIWRDLIREDAKQNDNEQSRSSYDFQLEKMHQV